MGEPPPVRRESVTLFGDPGIIVAKVKDGDAAAIRGEDRVDWSWGGQRKELDWFAFVATDYLA